MDPFLGTWTITDWQKDFTSAGEIPTNGFKIGASLFISGSDPNGSNVDLVWRNDDDANCSASGLQYDEGFQRLTGQTITTHFGEVEVPCDFTVELAPDDPGTLSLSIRSARGGLPDVGSGVVTATANPTGT